VQILDGKISLPITAHDKSINGTQHTALLTNCVRLIGGVGQYYITGDSPEVYFQL